MKAVPRARPALSDPEIVGSIARGDLQALGNLFDRYEPDVKRFISRLGVSAGDSDDLVQATFLEVLKASPRFDPTLSVKGWLFGLATILVRRHRRSLARTAKGLLAWASHLRHEPLPEAPNTAERDHELQRFQAALNRLSAKKREVFTLVVLESVSGEEAAQALDIPVNTVWTRLHHARRELRAALEEKEA